MTKLEQDDINSKQELDFSEEIETPEGFVTLQDKTVAAESNFKLLMILTAIFVAFAHGISYFCVCFVQLFQTLKNPKALMMLPMPLGLFRPLLSITRQETSTLRMKIYHIGSSYLGESGS